MLTDPALSAPFALGLSLPTLLGVGGFLIYAGADIALCLRRLSSDGIAFYLLNIAAAALIGVSLLYSFNLGAFLTELFCLGVSVLAVVLRLRDRRLHRTTPVLTVLNPPRIRPLHGARAMPGPISGPLGGTNRPGRPGGTGLCPDRMA